MRKKFMIRFGKRIIADFLQCNPLVVHRAVQGHRTRNMVTNEHIHDNFEVGVGMLDLGQSIEKSTPSNRSPP